MKEKLFVDTNILLYAYDRDAGIKHEQANALIKKLWNTGSGVLSVQVLQEFYVNVVKKIAVPLSPVKARSIIESYTFWEVVVNNGQTVLRASEIQERHQLSFWDALIVAAAWKAGVDQIMTEDFNHGQIIEGIRITNPFK